MNLKSRKPELLIPANNLEVLKTAVNYGADAIYIGGEAFSLRAKAKNFSPADMAEGIAYAHAHGVDIHVTVNILAHNADLEAARKYLQELRELKPDALIIADPGIFMMAREICPEIDIHVSTQANNTSYETFNFWYKLGAKRVVCARELSLAEIKEIRAHVPEDLEIEGFIHGAMCISYSGRCLLSNFMAGRDANHGACAHPCRWKYSVMEENRPGEYMPVYENERGTFIFNSKDLCMIDHIPDLIDAGINSFKIEGRMKTALYVATVARTYRIAIDDYLESEEKYRKHIPWYLEEMKKCTYRPYTTGFYYGKPDETTQVYENNTYVNAYTYLGIAAEVPEEKAAGYLDGATAAAASVGAVMPEGAKPAVSCVQIEQRNKFAVGDRIEMMKTDGRDVECTVLALFNQDGEAVADAPHPKQMLYVVLDEQCDAGDVLRIYGAQDKTHSDPKESPCGGAACAASESGER